MNIKGIYAKSTLAFSLTLVSLFFTPVAFGFENKDAHGASLHGEMIREALANRLCPANLHLIEQSCDSADDYFKGGKLKSGLAHIDREQKKLLNYAGEADVSPEARYRTLKHFGIMLRAAQDFYSRTNYVELEVKKMQHKQGKAFDPYQLELVDWSKLAQTNGFEAMDQASKQMESAVKASEDLGAATYFKAARELALRETGRQWDVLQSLIKNRYRDKAITILTALKEAHCPDKEPDDLD